MLFRTITVFLSVVSGGHLEPESKKSLFLHNGDICRGDPIAAEATTKLQSAREAAETLSQECKDMTEEQLNECSVPPIVHFILGFPGRFDFYSYYAVKAAHDRIQPDAIYLHLFGEPFEFSSYLESAINDFDIEVVLARTADRVFDVSVKLVEHRSDVIRLESLIRFGGIYFDLDVYAVQPVDVFYMNELTMPQEAPSWINNGVIIAKRCSRFLRLWYDQYKTFNPDSWNYHSIQLPGKLANEHPHLIKVETERIRSEFDETWKKLAAETFDENYWRNTRIIHSFIRNNDKKFDADTIGEDNRVFGMMIRQIMHDEPGLKDE